MLPNFFILGAAKCGTTSIYHYLKQHPEIFMSPVKEPCFFCETFQIIKNPIDYIRLFEGAGSSIRIGEASHVYLSNPATAKVLKSIFPDAKFVVVLRHPADRAYSLYHHMRRYGYETITTFEKALMVEEKRYRSELFKKYCNQYLYNFFYFRSGLFGEQLERFFSFFHPHQFYLITLTQLMQSPLDTIQKIYDFLNVRSNFIPNIKIFNQGETSKFPLLQNFINLKLQRPACLRRISLKYTKKYNWIPISPINPQTRQRLCRQYQTDLKKLYRLTGLTFDEK